MEPLTLGETAARIGAALLMGALIGLERERKHRPVGFRTMSLVSIGSAAFIIVAHEIIARNPASTTGEADMSRVLQGLIGGIGFLGAGAVIQSKRAVRGLTTAAAVWVTAGLGAACGLGLYILATVVVVATLFTLVVLEIVEERYFPDRPGNSDDGEVEKKIGCGKGGEDGNDDSGGPERLTHQP